eukprot:407505-Rhodomonas_salina.1
MAAEDTSLMEFIHNAYLHGLRTMSTAVVLDIAEEAVEEFELHSLTVMHDITIPHPEETLPTARMQLVHE